jgi:hypothetical protein
MALGLISGQRTTFDDQTDHIIQVEEGIKYLNPSDNGIKFVKKLLANRGDKVAKSYKYNWDETAIPTRREVVTTIINAVAVTVANAYAYHVGDILRVENELYRVTALTNATTLAVTSAYGGTVSAAHTAKMMLNLGRAGAENSTGPVAISTTAGRLFNYVEMFEDAVELSDQEIAELSTDMGNPMNRHLERITLSFWKRFAQAVFYGIRYEDTANKLHLMGGFKQFLTTNVTNVAGALTIAAIDTQILNIVLAGGNPDTIVLSPYQKQKLDALDANKQLLGKREHTGGNLVTSTWQSGVMDRTLDVVVDHALLQDELWILDSSSIAIIPLSNNGIDGRLSIIDGTAPGQAGTRKILRAYYTVEFATETDCAYLYGLS